MADIFISYSSHDRMQALSLAEKLRASGYDTWIDQHRIHGSARWGKEIVQAINASSLVAVLISSSSLGSENVVKELSLAAERHKHLLPIMLEACELTEEFAYHLTGLNSVEIENTDSIVKALEQLKIRTQSSGTDFSPSGRIEVRPTASKDIRLAVLPFDDLSKDHDNEWFADGMLDELISTLGGLDHMKVPSRTDVMYYKKHHPKAQEIASDLNVRYLVGGSVRKAGNKIRITASLTDAFNNQQLWTSNYDGNFDDIFELQERVSKEITETLKLRLTPEGKKKVEEQPTVNAEAYEFYLRGLEWQRHLSRDGYERALELYEKAVKLDPNYADAYLSIANTCGAYYRECSREPKWLRRAEENLSIAETITGETAKTLWIHGEIAWLKDELDEAEKHLLKAIELDPKHAQSYDILGSIYFKQELYTKAAQAFEKELEIRKYPTVYYNFLLSLSKLGDRDRLFLNAEYALPAFIKYIERNPNEAITKMFYAYSLYWAEKRDESYQIANKLMTIEEQLDGYMLYNLGSLFDDLGDPEKYISMAQIAVERGFRGIDGLRIQRFNNPQLQKQLNKLITILEHKIREESEKE